MDSVFIITGILGVLVAFGMVFLILKSTTKGVKERFESIANSVNGELKPSRFGVPQIQGNYEDIPFRIKYEHGSQGSPSRIRIEVLQKPPFELSLRRESADTKISKKIGIAKEMQIGIPDFDEQFFIQTNDKIRCQGYLGDSKIRETIKSIFERGGYIRFTRDKVEFSKPLTPASKGTVSKHMFIKSPQTMIDEEEIVGFLKEISFLSKSML